jgi:hypothetical protein
MDRWGNDHCRLFASILERSGVGHEIISCELGLKLYIFVRPEQHRHAADIGARPGPRCNPPFS